MKAYTCGVLSLTENSDNFVCVCVSIPHKERAGSLNWIQLIASYENVPSGHMLTTGPGQPVHPGTLIRA